MAGTGWAYSVNAGSFTKIGQHVYFHLRVTLTAKSGDATGNILIKGIPYAPKNGNNYYASLSVSNVLSLATAVVSLTGRMSPNVSDVSLYKRTAAAVSEAALGIADISATTTIHVSGFFVV